MEKLKKSCTWMSLALLVCSSVPAHAILTETKLAPTRIIWMSDSTGTQIKHPEILLEDFIGQVSTADPKNVVMKTTDEKQASILLDFGKEINGGLKIYSGMARSNKPVALRVRLGESVTEAMSDPNEPGNPQNSKNEHSLRDFVTHSPWLGSVRCGDSGFRFARIDLLDKDVDYLLRYVEAVQVQDNAPMIGSFECSDPRLTDIWNTGARTVQLCLQDYLWDGIKRDRLVWLGDTHPEVMATNVVFGENDVVNRSLDFGVQDAPLPRWMNGFSAYSLWWLISQHDLMLHHGNKDYYDKNRDYILGLVKQVDSFVDKDGKESLDGVRFLDWPTSEKPEVINSGLHSLIVMTMNAMDNLGAMAGDNELQSVAKNCLKRVKKVKVGDCGNSQAAALIVLAAQDKKADEAAKVILANGPDGFSTFYGYYMLEALAKAGYHKEAQDLMSKYWGAMLDLGATSFWEDLTYSQVADAGRIDEFVPEGKRDIHADGGAYCYVGLRLSLCHGWASGPTPWLTKYALGIYPAEAGSKTVIVDPKPGNLTWARGTYPTPYGPVKVDWRKGADGKIKCVVEAPAEVKVINKAK